MGKFFLTVINMSITASYAILFVMLARLLLKKAPKFIAYALWSVVAFRLVIPFSFESKLSIMPRKTTAVRIQQDMVYQQSPHVNSTVGAVESYAARNSLPAPVAEAGTKPFLNYLETGAYIWILGIIVLLSYSLVSVLILKKHLKSAQHVERNIYLAKNLKTPFVLGIIKPRIYLPVGLSENEKNYILIHEQTHIRRKDHIIKVMAFLILSVHWFNPLVWIAFMLMGTDMELSCDERVLKEINEDIKKPYASSLLSLAAHKHILNGNPLAFGEENVSHRIKNVLNYRKAPFWVTSFSIIVLVIVGVALISNPRQKNEVPPENKNLPATTEDNGHSAAGRVKIKLIYGIPGFDQVNEFETTEQKIISFIDSQLHSITPVKEADLENNHTAHYTIEMSGETGSYSCDLYHDTLYNKAYIVKDGAMYETITDFARYIDSLLENPSIKVYIDKDDAVELFRKYGWTLDYEIKVMNARLNNIRTLSGFDPNSYYFAYNNELSKDIGLDMSSFSETGIDVEIYRIYESMPQEFYPVKDCRGIVVRNNGRIIGAFISAGRHRTFNACSLKGNSFERITGKTVDEWLMNIVRADELDSGLSVLEPEQVIDKYFTALNNKDAEAAMHCISKKTLLNELTMNMADSELFNDFVALPLTVNISNTAYFDNLKSAKLLEVELIENVDEHTKIFRVWVDLKYRKEVIISSGPQFWDCRMVYESSQTGWKIAYFGH